MTEPNPLVSVIIPTYNRAALVPLAIQSALNQTHQNLEIIVIDDGSTDNTKEAVESIAEQDSRVKYLRHDTNKGVAAARNTGIMQARGEYIAFLDSDSQWMPEKIQKQLKVFHEGSQELGLVGSGRINVGGKHSGKKWIPNAFGDIYKKFLRGNCYPGGPPEIVIKKQCLEKVGLFDERLLCYEDIDLYIRIAKCYHFDAVTEPLVEIDFDAPNALSSNTLARFTGAKRMLEKYESEFPRISSYRSKYNSYIGGVLYSQGLKRLSRHYFRHALFAVVTL